ncbi:HU family DNA-binding protein [Candidatus Woesearchaeota archaeon]|nr:HU family DNA-binding protein [Candidatus Woesearchaeota archaeon]MCF7901044.1 HU family DNA-binding protein [Candidatus Woesearchaeota archaeon]MCF8013375.1 HU family DNA-binding protein [Candidatus Woesearchaeota archaeon]
MNKAELVEAVAKKTGFTKADSERALDATLESVYKGAKKSPVQLVGFGTFKYAKRKARTGVNPATGAKLKIPAKTVFVFKASKNPKF